MNRSTIRYLICIMLSMSFGDTLFPMNTHISKSLKLRQSPTLAEPPLRLESYSIKKISEQFGKSCVNLGKEKIPQLLVSSAASYVSSSTNNPFTPIVLLEAIKFASLMVNPLHNSAYCSPLQLISPADLKNLTTRATTRILVESTCLDSDYHRNTIAAPSAVRILPMVMGLGLYLWGPEPGLVGIIGLEVFQTISLRIAKDTFYTMVNPKPCKPTKLFIKKKTARRLPTLVSNRIFPPNLMKNFVATSIFLALGVASLASQPSHSQPLDATAAFEHFSQKIILSSIVSECLYRSLNLFGETASICWKLYKNCWVAIARKE